MANSSKSTSVEAQNTAVPASPSMSVIAPAVAWLIPGAGHLVQKRWIRGALLMASITTMFVLGLLMQGRVYHPNGGDILDMLGFVGDVGAGGLYIVTRMQGWGHGAIAHATADYGTKFLIVAGLLNFICAADAYHIAIGKRPCSEKPNDPGTLPFHRCRAVLSFRFGGFRHHPAQHFARPVPLRPILLRPVRRWSVRGGMGDVDTATLERQLLTSSF